MNCRHVEALLHGHADDELDAWRRRSVDRHLRDCRPCTARREAVVDLRARVRADVPRYTAPAELEARVRAMAAAVEASSVPSRRHERDRVRWLTGGVIAGCAASALAWTLGTTLLVARSAEDFAVAAVTTHVRATLDDRLIAVASSDQHTVKPWLSARLDYSPPVTDLADEGFPLVGGRVEQMDGRAVATLVYRYRGHTIDVFVRPRSTPAFAAAASVGARSVRGFNVMRAQGATMDWLAVSDAEPEALHALVRRLAQEDPAR